MQIPTLIMWLCWAILFTTIDGAKREAGQLLISNGRRTTAAQVPWHAGIYRLSNGSYDQRCGGTLVSAKVVVTAAHCFWDNQRSRKANTTTGVHIVALGKYHRDWEVEDEDMQRMGIAGIFLHKRFRGRKRNYEYDVAVVQLVKAAQLTISVQFALVDWDHTYDSIQLVEGRKGIVAGWGLTENGTSSDALMSVELPYVENLPCYDMLSEDLQIFVTHDKFCAGYTARDTSVCPGDSGGGWVFRRIVNENGDWTSSNYLRGVVSVAFTPASHDQRKCFAQQVAGFSSLTDSATLRWIKEFPIDIILNPCEPSPCGLYSACVVAGSEATCSCLPSYLGRPPFCRPQCHVTEDCPEDRDCVDNVCHSPCPRLCGQDALCTAIGRGASCRCPQGYIGDPQVLCELEPCGKRNEDLIPLIAGGHSAIDGEFPWNAALFKIQPDGTHQQICGGTLVRRNIVITAALCVFDEYRNRLRSSASLKVALGKWNLAWDADLDDPHVQRYKVDAIFVREEYNGSRLDYTLDIAILKLSTNATLTREVNVACVDWANRDKLKTGSVGTIAGWGFTSNSTIPSDTLQWIDLPWVDINTCRRNTYVQARLFLSHDKFCAGYLNQGRSICAGDSGAGLLFREEASNRYFLRGVASLGLGARGRSPFCNAEHYSAFTSVAYHIDWLQEHIDT